MIEIILLICYSFFKFMTANSLLLMLRNVAGDQNFRNALITYMDR